MIVRGGAIVRADATHPTVGDIVIRDGLIAEITEPNAVPPTEDEIDATGCVVMPGVVDPHVHFGISAPVGEDFVTESRAAAHGGVTTVISFNKSMGSYHDVVPGWIETAAANSHVDFAFHLGVFTDQHVAELSEYVERYGVSSFKFFMSYRGVERSKFGIDNLLDDAFLFELLRVFGAHPALPRLCVHCENMELVRDATKRLGRTVTDLRDWHTVRSGWSEADAMVRTLLYAEATGANVYIVHVSSKEAASRARWAAQRMRPEQAVFESCPHYLALDIDEAQDRVGVLAKVNPPVRSRQDSDALWLAIRDGTITTIGSDHVPRPRATKVGDGTFMSATAGFPGLELTLPLLITTGAEYGVDVADVARLTATNPAATFGLGATKGRIDIGYDADLVVVDTNEQRTVRAADMLSSSGYSPYEGMTLRGWPRATVLRGVAIMRDGVITSPSGHGRYLRQEPGSRA